MSAWLQKTLRLFGNTQLLESYQFSSRKVRMRLPLFFGCGIPEYFLSMANTSSSDSVNINVYANIILHHGDVFGLNDLPTVPGNLGFIPQVASSIVGELNLEPHVIFDQTYILASVHHSAHNFYHFMVDYFSYTRFDGMGLEPWIPVFLTKERKSFQAEAPRLLLGRELEFRYLPTTYLHRKLALPSVLNKTDVVDFLREKSKQIKPAGSNRRLYITRRAAATRRVVNEDDLMPILLKHGFEVIDSESLALVDQIPIFKSADLICAPHGAGLTNIVFCKEKTQIIEFFLEERLPLSGLFWELGCAAQLIYSFVKAQRVINPSNAHPSEGDLLVSPHDLDEALSQALLSSI